MSLHLSIRNMFDAISSKIVPTNLSSTIWLVSLGVKRIVLRGIKSDRSVLAQIHSPKVVVV